MLASYASTQTNTIIQFFLVQISPAIWFSNEWYENMHNHQGKIRITKLKNIVKIFEPAPNFFIPIKKRVTIMLNIIRRWFRYFSVHQWAWFLTFTQQHKKYLLENSPCAILVLCSLLLWRCYKKAPNFPISLKSALLKFYSHQEMISWSLS